MGSSSFLRLDGTRASFLLVPSVCWSDALGSTGDSAAAGFGLRLLGGGSSENSGVIDAELKREAFALEERREYAPGFSASRGVLAPLAIALCCNAGHPLRPAFSHDRQRHSQLFSPK